MPKRSKDYFLHSHPFLFSTGGDVEDQLIYHPDQVEWVDPPSLPLPAYERPADPQDVPPPLRHNIRYAHESGVKKEHLAMIYGYPLAWIELFCLSAEEHAN